MSTTSVKEPPETSQAIEAAQRVLLELAVGDLARSLAQFAALEVGADPLAFAELTKPAQDRFMLLALRAKDLINPDVINEDREGAIADVAVWLDGPGQRPGVEADEIARHAITAFVARQLTPRAL